MLTELKAKEKDPPKGPEKDDGMETSLLLLHHH